ncbi:MAG TPA: hypothetical protein VMF89_31110 [Polyangiales bacterium]|nr:hypothetical protein [Polyangiales bacterium]
MAQPGSETARYFPAVCAAGHRPYVVRIELPVQEMPAPPCPECGGDARFIPGAYYAEAFVPTVERAMEIVHSAQLSGLVAQEAARILSQSLGEPSSARLREVFARYDGLHAVRSMLPDVVTATNQRDVRNLVGLIVALLPACAPPSAKPSVDVEVRRSEAPPPPSGLLTAATEEPEDPSKSRAS